MPMRRTIGILLVIVCAIILASAMISVMRWYVGNILFGGLLGFVFIDPATGAMWVIEPKNLNITLQPEANQAPTGQ
jgi:hypothetical protein